MAQKPILGLSGYPEQLRFTFASRILLEGLKVCHKLLLPDEHLDVLVVVAEVGGQRHYDGVAESPVSPEPFPPACLPLAAPWQAKHRTLLLPPSPSECLATLRKMRTMRTSFSEIAQFASSAFCNSERRALRWG